MDFFGHQDRARRSSGRLVILFSVAVAAVAGSIALLAGLLLGRESGGGLDAGAFLGAGAATLAVIGIGALLKTASLAAGGRRVAEALGGRLVQAGAASPAERRLLNVVEEMALAAGVPVPLVFVLDAEPGINAFAAGRTPEDAAVAVTRGALETFSRDELQGVIAHEFSHILNGDMRLNLRLMGLLGGILALTVIGRILLRAGSVSTGRRKKDGAGLALVGLGLVVIGWVGVLAGRMIQAAVSRQREYLADASAVQFTRNPDGIGGALRKIRDVVTGSRVAAPAAAEASHMFFGPVSAAFLFATHPPLDERIARVEGLPLEELRAAAPPPPSAVSRGEVLAAGFAAAAARAAGADLPPGSMESAARIAGRLPGPLRDALGNGLGAAATVSALLLDRDPAVRT
ncbi:MAG: M48 family metallopeptidase, partial [Deltaproteobacteria bacterium]|nr:M48 family metallopeptidase [Deltaproteobacteria bacterium]